MTLRDDAREVLAGIGLGASAAALVGTVVWFRYLAAEMANDRGTIRYLAECHFATDERERAWAEARKPPVTKCRPDPVHWRFTGGE